MTVKIDYDYIYPKDPKNPTLIFIHGAGGDKSQWYLQKKYFIQQECGIIVLTLPGHGNSSNLGVISIQSYAKSLYDLFITLNLKKTILVGHSMGGAIALQIVLQFRELNIENLVLIGSGARLRVSSDTLKLIEKDFINALKKIEKDAYHETTKRELKLKNGLINIRNGAEIFKQDFLACDDFNVISQLSDIDIPTLIICGKEDHLTPVKWSTYLHDSISKSSIYIIPESSHFVFQEKPDEVNRLIERWIFNIHKRKE